MSLLKQVIMTSKIGAESQWTFGNINLSTCPVLVGFGPAVLGSGIGIIMDFFMSQTKKSNYNVKKLLMVRQLEPGTAGLEPIEIGHVDRVCLNWTCGQGRVILRFALCFALPLRLEDRAS